MIITGYHGTSNENADNIINNKLFNPSDSEKDWLGKGIYFYEKYIDAAMWKNKDGKMSEVVLHSILQIDDNAYLDFDKDEGKKLFEGMMGIIIKSGLKISDKSAQRNQCSVMNYIWQKFPEIQAVFASFPKEPSRYPVMLQYRKLRREFCVRNNSSIKNTIVLERVIENV